MVSPGTKDKARIQLVTLPVNETKIIWLQKSRDILTPTNTNEGPYTNLVTVTQETPIDIYNKWPLPEKLAEHLVTREEFQKLNEPTANEDVNAAMRILAVQTDAQGSWTDKQNALMKAVVIEAVTTVNEKLNSLHKTINTLPTKQDINAIRDALDETHSDDSVKFFTDDTKLTPKAESLIQVAAAQAATSAAGTVAEKVVSKVTDTILGSDEITKADVKGVAANIIKTLQDQLEPILEEVKKIPPITDSVLRDMTTARQLDNIMTLLVNIKPAQDDHQLADRIPSSKEVRDILQTIRTAYENFEMIMPNSVTNYQAACADEIMLKPLDDDDYTTPDPIVAASRFGEEADEDIDDSSSATEHGVDRLPGKCDILRINAVLDANTNLLVKLCENTETTWKTAKQIEVHLYNIVQSLKIRPILPLVGPLNWHC